MFKNGVSTGVAASTIVASLLSGGLAGFAFGKRAGSEAEVVKAHQALLEAEPIVLAATLNHPTPSKFLPNLSQGLSPRGYDEKTLVEEHASKFFEALRGYDVAKTK